MKMETIDWQTFQKVDMRIGTIVEARVFHEAIKPAYQLVIDFGPELGHKKSSAQITVHYSPENLIGKQVVAVVNLGPKQIGKWISECLVLGFNYQEGIGLIGSELTAINGERIH
jgi:tRNA-binding protein